MLETYAVRSLANGTVMYWVRLCTLFAMNEMLFGIIIIMSK